MSKIGVVLSGCGVFDGSEIHEAVAVLLALARAGVNYQCMSPDTEQMHVVNHFTGEVSEGKKRNVLVESARIARGDIKSISSVNINDYDGLVFPGGFGAAKNLCDFAATGADCNVNSEVARLVQAAHAAGKPMAFVCISPVIAAALLGNRGVKVTIGDDEEAAGQITEMGGRHMNCAVKEMVIDNENKIITSPAYMKAENIAELFDDVTASVNALIEMVNNPAASSA
ncbi:isoprenoid biosynthesis glyoxalase ElbB [bacterium]|nr:isoprenoid biosynthesis glyoxalase ElbB [bacterium]